MASVLEGKKGYLFLSNDTNKSVDQIEGRLNLDERFFHLVHGCHEVRDVYLSSLGVLYLHALIPNKESLLKDYLSDDVQWAKFDLPPAFKYFEKYPKSLSYFNPSFSGYAEPENLFSRLDTHWNHLGALNYLKEFLLEKKLTQRFNLLSNLPVTQFDSTQAGDLGSKIGLPDESITVIAPADPKFKLVFSNNIVNEGCFRHYLNSDNEVNGRLVLFHDSTSMWLFSWFASIFKEVIAIHSPDVDLELVKNLQPDFVFFFQVERFFVRPPSNEIYLYSFIRENEVKKNSEKSAVPYIDEFCQAIKASKSA